jgi:uncharacterized RDD family membrane protein YckC
MNGQCSRCDPRRNGGKEAIVDNNTQEMRPAPTKGRGYGVRAAAYVIDNVVVLILALAMQFVMAFVAGIALAAVGSEPQFDTESTSLLWTIISLIQFALYFAIFEWLYGATVGKMLLRLRVVRENGDACGLGPALVRAVLRWVDGLFWTLPAVISMHGPDGTSMNQRIGDKAAKTFVVGAKEPCVRQQRTGWHLLLACALYGMLSIISATAWILAALS